MQRRGAVAGRAAGQPCEQDWSGDDPRRGHPRVVRLEGGLHGIELDPFDNRWRFDRDPLVDRLLAMCS